VKCLYPITAWRSRETPLGSLVFSLDDGIPSSMLKLPCGKCIACRLEHSRRWAIRCIHEASMFEKNCFITLTYNNENLPKNLSLVKSDYQLFMKRMRKKYGENIRFFACGEYGEMGSRPHYHACIFNHNFKDAKIFSKRNGVNLYFSEELNKLWKKGFATIGEVNFETAAYVARYVLKKITGDKAKEHYGERIPEFILMSRGSHKLKTGGIGKSWFDKYHADIYNHDILIIRGGIKCRPPKYYDTLYDSLNHDAFTTIQLKRKEKISKPKKSKTLTQILNKVKSSQIKLKKLNKGKTL